MAYIFGSYIRRHLKLLFVAILLGFLVGAMSPGEAWSASEKRKISAKKSDGSAKKATKPKAAAKAKPKAAAKRQVPAKKSAKGSGPGELPFPENVKALAGSGAVLITDNHVGDGQSRELFSLNPDKAYVPASILKLVTAGAALDALGLDYRYRTEFYLDPDRNLWIVGRGDPFLVSEELCLIMERLRQIGLRQVKDIYLDTSYFQPGLVLDGNTFTNNPYDAYNLALGVNFNTVNYLIDKKGQIVECDPCSPLTPVALEVAKVNFPKKRNKKRYPREFRFNISSSPADAEKNSGQMIKALLEKNQIEVAGQIVLGQTLPPNAKMIYAHASSKTLEEMVKDLLRHSNNYVTNQIFLTLGAEMYGPPATPEKAHRAVLTFLAKYDLPTITMVEGSGLSRQNSVTARQMARVLGTLEPVRRLIHATDDGSVIYKTGTMSDVQTLAGYLVRPDREAEPLTFVILLNGRYKAGTREKILGALKAHFIGGESQPEPQKTAEAAPKAAGDPQDRVEFPPRGGGGLFAPAESAF
ncbi:MAG: D-alanyl-D-alanine carboxypeptidase [Deltaproteobacteria bacterium]|jgi:D-alanyl-D-alanine carboxypeptidase/D-alanyl-D-alanine-endopeptidase (penicillin-binding protein 4)|nr:D-alanyl-D-alanine carboxypeptidase [Deltaproteobacteria bacterium]